VIPRERCRVSAHWSQESSSEGGVMTRRSCLVAVAITIPATATTMAAAQGRIPGRLLAVSEDATGEPVAGVVVADLATNISAVIPASGASSLAGPGAGTPILAIRKIGCAALMVPVTVSAIDTASITIVLKEARNRRPRQSGRRAQHGDVQNHRRAFGVRPDQAAGLRRVDKCHSDLAEVIRLGSYGGARLTVILNWLRPVDDRT
jgi:hypothetical protein